LFDRKLLRALFSVVANYGARVLLDVIGTGTSYANTEAFRAHVREVLEHATWAQRVLIDDFLEKLLYVHGRCTDKEGAKRIAEAIMAYRAEHPAARELHYFAIWPKYFVPTLERYVENNVLSPVLVKHWVQNGEGSRVKVVLEKPLAETVSQACALESQLGKTVGRDNVRLVFRAYDHYPFKNGVWGILVWRFGNHISEPTHNHAKVAYIGGYAYERVRVGKRNGFVGQVMDMLANHLMSIYGFLRVGHPRRAGDHHFVNGSWQDVLETECLDANWLHGRLISIANELQNPGVIVQLDLARYTKGVEQFIGAGGKLETIEVPGYLQEDEANPLIETGGRLVLRPGVPLAIDPSDRWGQETIFALASAKGTAVKKTAYDIVYRDVPKHFFAKGPFRRQGNLLVPNERGIVIEEERFVEVSRDKFELQRFWGDSRQTMVPGAEHLSMEPRTAEHFVPLPDVGDGYPQAMVELLVPEGIRSSEDAGEAEVASLCLFPAEFQLAVIKTIVPLLEKAREQKERWVEYPAGTIPVWPEIKVP
jgi:glucose-6-phosphate 1-dehydrogenase